MHDSYYDLHILHQNMLYFLTTTFPLTNICLLHRPTYKLSKHHSNCHYKSIRLKNYISHTYMQ